MSCFWVRVIPHVRPWACAFPSLLNASRHFPRNIRPGACVMFLSWTPGRTPPRAELFGGFLSAVMQNTHSRV